MQQQLVLNKKIILDDVSEEERLSELNEEMASYRRGGKDFLDELSPAQVAELHKANEQYERGETIPYEAILEKYKRWERK
jgi:hypothetical protein